MSRLNRWLSMALMTSVGLSAGLWLSGSRNTLEAGSNDRHEDFIMCTGPLVQPLSPVTTGTTAPSSTSSSSPLLGLGGFFGFFTGNSATPNGTNPTQEQIKQQLDKLNQVNGAAPVNIQGNLELDGLWLLDYRAGKLLATTLNRLTGELAGWAEADLVEQFSLTPRSNVHFVMTTGNVFRGQSVLYLCETVSGKIGVYSMGMSDLTGTDRKAKVAIHRHDMTSFRGTGLARNSNTPGGVVQGGGMNSWNNQLSPGNNAANEARSMNPIRPATLIQPGTEDKSVKPNNQPPMPNLNPGAPIPKPN